jgi:hypothetical protein
VSRTLHHPYRVTLSGATHTLLICAGVVIAGPPDLRAMQGWTLARVREFVAEHRGEITKQP